MNISLRSKFKNFFLLVEKKKSFVIYTLFKYLEYTILALIFLDFANLVTPGQYGDASLGFQIITFSAFTVLGVNQVLVKRYSLENKKEIQVFLLQYNIVYNIIMSLLLFVGILMAVNKSYVFFLGLLCSSKLLMESAVSISRIKNKFNTINIIYLSYSFFFLIAYFVFVDNTFSFFRSWSFSILFGTTIGILLSILPILKSFSLKNFFLYLSSQGKEVFQDGIKLALVGSIAPLVIVISILLLHYNEVEKELIGNFQLADNISNIISLSASSVLFISFPNILKRVYDNKRFILRMYKIGFIILLFSGLGMVLSYFPVKAVIDFFFPQYKSLPYLIYFTLVCRFLLLFLFVPNLFWISQNKENRIIVYSLIFLLFLVLSLQLFLLFFLNSVIKDYYILIQIIALLILHFLIYRKVRNKLKCD